MLLKNKFFIFFCYLIIALIAYSTAIQIGFLSDDYIGLKNCSLSFAELNKQDVLFQPLSHFFTSALFYFFHLNPLPYHLFSIVSLVLCGFSAYLFIHYFFNFVVQDNSNGVNRLAIVTGILVILNPYNTEAVSWISGKSYLLCSMMLFFSFAFYLKYRFSNQLNYLIASILFFISSLLSKEISIPFPLILLVFELLFYSNKNNFINDFSFKKKIGIVFLFSAVLFIYLTYRTLLLGNVLGGSGVSKSFKYQLFPVVYTTFLYHVKFFLMYRFIPFELKLIFKYIAANYLLLITIASSIILLIGRKMLQINWQPNKNKIRVLAFFYISFLISLLPVLTLETSFLGEIQSDRYGFLPGFFFIIFIAILLHTTIKKHSVVICTLSALAIFFMYNTVHENQSWKQAYEISKNMLTSAKDLNLNNKNVVIINIPDNYRGAYIFRTGFKEALELNKIAQSKTLEYITSMGISSIDVQLISNNYADNKKSITATQQLYFLNINTEIGVWNKGYRLDKFSKNKIDFQLKTDADSIVFLFANTNGILKKVN
jgi:hypothetical protein